MPNYSRKPTILKRREGTYRPDRANPKEPNGLPGIPDPPRAFIFGNETDWNRVTKVFGEFGVLQVQHAEAIYRLVEALGETEALASSAKAGNEINLTRRGKLESDIRSWLKDFGMTPSDQSRVSVVEQAIENTFESLRKPSPVLPIS